MLSLQKNILYNLSAHPIPPVFVNSKTNIEKFINEAIRVANSSDQHLNQPIISLQEQTAIIYLGDIKSISDLYKANIVSEICPFGLQIILKKIIGQKLLKLGFYEDRELIMLVAKERIKLGEPCDCMVHTIGTYNYDYKFYDYDCYYVKRYILELEAFAVNGPAKDRVLSGEHFSDVANELGIRHYIHRKKLEEYMVNCLVKE